MSRPLTPAPKPPKQEPKTRQPMKPKGMKKRPDEYDHARGCPLERKKRGAVSTPSQEKLK